MRLDKRVRSNKPRKPLRSFNELAEMLSLKPAQLAPLMRCPNAPKADLVTNHTKGNITHYYEPEAFIKWYKGRK